MPAKISGSGKGGKDSLADLITCGFVGFAVFALGSITVGNVISGYLNRKSLEEQTRRHQPAEVRSRYGPDSRTQSVQHPETSSRYGHVSRPNQGPNPLYVLIPGRFNGRELEPTSHWYAFDDDGNGKVDELVVWRNMDRGLITDLSLVYDALRTPQGRSIEHYVSESLPKEKQKFVTTLTQKLTDEKREHFDYLFGITRGKQ